MFLCGSLPIVHNFLAEQLESRDFLNEALGILTSFALVGSVSVVTIGQAQ